MFHVAEEWNETTAESARTVCVHQLFEAQVERTPEAIALRFGGMQLTYRELNARANQLARFLARRGATPGVLVGIAVDRSPDMVVALLGILKSGAAYLPLDPGYPYDRLQFMIEDAGVSLTVRQHRPGARALPQNDAAVCLDSDRPAIAREDAANFSSGARPQDLAYVIYTSGSTGKPKGVQIPHGAAVNFLTSMAHQPGLTSKDTLLAVTTLSFDIAGLECYLPLTVGAKIVLASREVAADGARLLELLNTSGANVMQATPATWRLLLDAGWEPGKMRLKVLCGGEALPGALAGQILKRCGSLWNMYGPTETTIWSTLQRIDAAGQGAAPIGRPIANTQVYAVDANLQPVPAGVAGELLIGGDGVAWGYRNRPALTAEKFVPDPFGRVPGARLYRTGDLVRCQQDGNIEFLGRIDHQVKVRGFRIELGEIEAVLGAHPAVREVVVLAREDVVGDPRLVAYLVADPQRVPAASELRRFLQQKLADYMIPSAFVTLDALPRTLNGKIDRRALPAPESGRRDLEKECVAPRDALEQQLATLWEEVLGVRPIGVKDNIFDLGAHSLVIARVFARIQRIFGKHVSPGLLLEAPTIEQVAARLRVPPDKSAWTPRVMLHPGGSGTPFFCVHGGQGGIYLFRTLAQLLGDDRPVYGLQSLGAPADAFPYRTIEEIAACYTRAVLEVQAQGPFLVGGYCFGGIVAYEMAQQLRRAGHEVALVVSFNGPNPAARKRSPARAAGLARNQASAVRAEEGVAGRPRSIWRVARKPLAWLYWSADHVLREATRLCRVGVKRLLIRWYLVRGRTLPLDLQEVFFMDVNTRAEERYAPGSYAGRMAVFRGDQFYKDSYLGTDPDLGWRELVGECLKTHEVRGTEPTRSSVLEEPSVHRVVETLRATFRRATLAGAGALTVPTTNPVPFEIAASSLQSVR
jgi:amino acid adenylation domain-containing protein